MLFDLSGEHAQELQSRIAAAAPTLVGKLRMKYYLWRFHQLCRSYLSQILLHPEVSRLTIEVTNITGSKDVRFLLSQIEEAEGNRFLSAALTPLRAIQARLEEAEKDIDDIKNNLVIYPNERRQIRYRCLATQHVWSVQEVGLSFNVRYNTSSGPDSGWSQSQASDKYLVFPNPVTLSLVAIAASFFGTLVYLNTIFGVRIGKEALPEKTEAAGFIPASGSVSTTVSDAVMWAMEFPQNHFIVSGIFAALTFLFLDNININRGMQSLSKVVSTSDGDAGYQLIRMDREFLSTWKGAIVIGLLSGILGIKIIHMISTLVS